MGLSQEVKEKLVRGADGGMGKAVEERSGAMAENATVW